MNKPPLSDDAILDILTSRHVDHHEMGRRYGRSHQRIASIRLGRQAFTRLPEIPRWTATKNCRDCIHWGSIDRPCGLGFPDPVEMGPRFATECPAYLQA